ncbi:4-hydroxymandelate oxidase [Paraconexibacter sp. AEG42_29]|uniref:4-hydroxymandelate oxidase n=1 Tax=Paraconexibacter sp. AEG42_29 TaxID=2997339 RepID=A0AAU7B1P5_9ACTN
MELLRAHHETARSRLPQAVYDYFAGGAGDEQTLAENVSAWRDRWLVPRVLTGVGAADPAVTLLGARLASPVLLAPVAAQRLLHPEGELAAARAAAAAGSVYVLSTRATTDLADVAAAAPAGDRWFQLYVGPDPAAVRTVLARAAEHGYSHIVLTVDFSVAGRRERELRHGPVPFPPGVGLATHLGHAAADTAKPPVGGWRALSWDDVAWVREASGLPVLVKGVLTGEDARLAVDAGACAVIVSNHGGRQLDGCLPTAVALPDVAAAVAGTAPVLVDGGIRDGGDVVRALALGAAAVLVGRPYAWGLAADGEAGVRAVLDALREDTARALALVGAGSPAALTAAHVRRRP